jgi:hypothetical protein
MNFEKGSLMTHIHPGEHVYSFVLMISSIFGRSESVLMGFLLTSMPAFFFRFHALKRGAFPS